MNIITITLLMSLFLMAQINTVNAATVYVNVNAAVPGGDGTSWLKAFRHLQDGLLNAQNGDEIWVAQGIYYPDKGIGQTNNSAFSSFTLVDGVSLYGGFEGTESEQSQRDSINNITILSGDIDGNDNDDDGDDLPEYFFDLLGLNAYHVLNGANVDTDTLVDGFTVSAGYANGTTNNERKGGAIYCGNNSVSGPNFNHMVFYVNRAYSRGGAFLGCSQHIQNALFFRNYAGGAAGAVAANGGLMENVVFQENHAFGSGGAILNGAALLVIKSSSFIGNDSFTQDGGAIKTSRDIDLDNVLFSGNNVGSETLDGGVEDFGGALYIDNSNQANAILTNVTMVGNYSSDRGGAIYSKSTGTLEIRNSIIWNNADQTTGLGTSSASVFSLSSVVNNSYSLIQGYAAVGVGNVVGDPLFVLNAMPATDPTILGNARLTIGSPAIDSGDNSLSSILLDLDGDNRIINATVDMGAYEFSRYAISVTVTGLDAGTLVLQNNGGDDLTFNDNGTQVFSTELTNITDYLVTVLDLPTSPNQACIITNGSGAITGAIISVGVICVTLQYTVAVNVTGLATDVTLVLLNNAEELEVTSIGINNFTISLNDLSDYEVSITAQPSNPNQQCLITSNNASGIINGADEVIAISCTTTQYTVGVDVSGLANGNSVSFENNGEGLIVSNDGQFNFATSLEDGSAYVVSIISQPDTPSQMCSVISTSDNVSGANVLLTVNCSTNQYLVSGIASGLASGNSVSLSLGDDDLNITSNAAFVFTNPLIDESSYSVVVSTQPTVPNQTCVLVNSMGNIGGNDVTDLQVNCSINQYVIGGIVTGLCPDNNLILQNNSGDDLIISNEGDFDFVTNIEDLQGYNVSILSQPNNPIQPCFINNNSGTGNVSGDNIITVSIFCELGDDLIFKNGFE